MAGLIQTAIGQLLGATGAAIAAGGKAHEKNERQAIQEGEEEKEAQAVATEADLQIAGASPEAAKAYRLAQERGSASPERIIFDKDGKPLATYSEMAELLAGQSLNNTFSARLRSKHKIQERRKLLEGRTHEERVKNAVLSEKGSK